MAADLDVTYRCRICGDPDDLIPDPTWPCPACYEGEKPDRRPVRWAKTVRYDPLCRLAIQIRPRGALPVEGEG